jgi:hypothetical protein
MNRAGNVLKDQAQCEGIEASPLHPGAYRKKGLESLVGGNYLFDFDVLWTEERK